LVLLLHKSDYCEIGIPLINPTNISVSGIKTNNLERINDQKYKELSKYILKFGDLVIARRGNLSKIAIISKKEDGWLCGTGSFFLRTVLVQPNYIKCLYQAPYIQDIISQNSIGQTMNNLNQGILSNILIPLPPLAEQGRIVAKIEELFRLLKS